MKRLRYISAALAATLLLIGQAKADMSFDYSTSTATNPTPATFGGTTVSFSDYSNQGPETPIPGVGVGIDINQVSITSSTAPPADDTGTFTLTDTITIAPTAGGTGNLVVVGTFNLTSSNTSNQTSNFVFNSALSTTSVTIGGVTYSYNGVSYSQPSVNVPNSGSLGITVLAAVPEPSSVALACVGGLLAAAPRLRRLARSRRA